MLKSIYIKNFKKIWNSWIELLDLWAVNYLVWENGSGKSSILEAMYFKSQWHSFVEKSKESISIPPFLNSDSRNQEYFDCSDITKNSVLFATFLQPILIDFIYWFFKENSLLKWIQAENQNEMSLSILFHYWEKNNFIDLSLVRYADIFNSERIMEYILPNYDNEKILNDINYQSSVLDQLNRHKWFFILDFLKTEDLSQRDMSEGYIKMYSILALFMILQDIKDKKIEWIMPLILIIEEPELSLNPGLQKIIPDLLDYWSSRLWIQIFISTHSSFIISAATAFDNQKVYRIENWRCLNPNWSNGKRVVFDSAQMLGMGIDDYVVAPNNPVKDKSYIVYCEGRWEDGLSDWEIYNTIFRKHKNVLFISCQSCQDVYRQYIAWKEFYKNQLGQIEIIGLIDNDSENSNIEEWKSIGITILERREIENYIYDLEIVSSLLSTSEILNEAISKIDIIKSDLKTNSIIHQQLKDKHQELAGLVGNDTNIYRELELCIFWK